MLFLAFKLSAGEFDAILGTYERRSKLRNLLKGWGFSVYIGDRELCGNDFILSYIERNCAKCDFKMHYGTDSNDFGLASKMKFNLMVTFNFEDQSIHIREVQWKWWLP